MYSGIRKGSVFKEVRRVVCIIGEAKIVRVRVWAMTYVVAV